VAASLDSIFAAGAAALDANDFGRAEALFGSIVAADPRSHEAWNALAVVAVRAGAPEIATERARRALEFDRRNPLYLNNLGVAYGELRDFAAAEAQFRRALKAKPVYAEALYNLGKVLHKQGRLGDALKAYERAYAIDADHAGLRLNLAGMYLLHGRAERCVATLDQERGERSDSFVGLYAEALAELQGREAGIFWLERQVEMPGGERHRFALGTMLLGRGRWQEGWNAYQSRRSPSAAERVGHHAGVLPPRLDSKRIVLRGEQGLGDRLFFLRFAPRLRELGAHVTLQCAPALAGVLRGAAAADEMIDENAPLDLGKFDYRIWLGDLPQILENADTPPALALRRDADADARAARQLAGFGPAPYLGITWRAGTDVLVRQEFAEEGRLLSKEISPALLGAALRGWSGTLLALQRHPAPGEIEALSQAAQQPVHNLSAANENLAKMLALLGQLQDYVTVSNTNLHLHAGIGGRAHVLVPRPAEWRWMDEGERSPWFPEFPIYRQPPSRDWTEPLSRLRRDLIG